MMPPAVVQQEIERAIRERAIPTHFERIEERGTALWALCAACGGLLYSGSHRGRRSPHCGYVQYQPPGATEQDPGLFFHFSCDPRGMGQAPARTATPRRVGRPAPGPYVGLLMADAVLLALDAAREPMMTGALADALRAGGCPYATTDGVRTALRRHHARGEVVPVGLAWRRVRRVRPVSAIVL